MDFTSGLNPEQRDAVLQSDGAVLILAGAGSGKTRVIAHRIAHMVSQGLAPPDGILAVTFTNKAAEEMRSRVAALLQADCSRMWISTFHSLCARLLRREAPAIGLSRDHGHGSLRFSLSRETTQGELDYVLSTLPSVVEKLRRLSPLARRNAPVAASQIS